MDMRLLGAAILLCMPDVLHAFAIEDTGDVFNRMTCPAFLMFDNAAYLADMTFELPCNCKPEEVSAVVWYFQRNSGSRRTIVLTDFAGTVVVDSSHINSSSNILKRFSIRMFSLIVFQAQVEDSGHYLCGSRRGEFFYGYDVDVQPSSHIKVAFLDSGQHVRRNATAKRFTFFTTFWDWSRCDRCGVRGEQRRIGLCYVRSPFLHPRYRTALPNVTSCGSRAVPARLQRAGRHRTPEVAIRSCLTPCPKEKIFKEGKQSISSVISGMSEKPQLPTQHHKQVAGSDLTIGCPGARPEHAVAWDKGSTRFYRSRYLLGVNRSMRVFIDHGNHLHFRRIRVSDGGTYFCWHEGKMVASFKLTVSRRKRRKRMLSDPETIFAMRTIGFGYIIITILFLIIHMCRCCRRVLGFTEKK
ncbi:F187A protein, partial [Turnix velox]|nr:F187A protein [Turnix velox]